MWAIKILTGPQAGQVFQLNAGKNLLGRGPHCDIKLMSNGVSKEHAHILITEDKLILMDNNSRNGSFVNGVKVQNQRINLGDKLAFHDVLIDLLKLPDLAMVAQAPRMNMQTNSNLAVQFPQHSVSYSQPMPQYQQFDPQMMSAGSAPNPHIPQSAPKSVGEVFENFRVSFAKYIDQVALPGIYSFSESIEFRWVVGIFVGIFILLVTALSALPMSATVRQSIEAESKRRVQTIAKAMAEINRNAILGQLEVSINTQTASIEDGVEYAAIISAVDGHIMGPASSRSQTYDKSFIRKIRNTEKPTTDMITDTEIGASHPIFYYDQTRGQQTPIAYAVVIYDIASVGIRTEQTFSLFIETFVISLLFGSILYYILMKIIEHPIELVNTELDMALREGRDSVQTSYQMPVLQALVSNISSALVRVGQSSNSQQGAEISLSQREHEATQLVEMIGTPALAFSAIDSKIIAANQAFLQKIHSQPLNGQGLASILDTALRKCLEELIQSLSQQPDNGVSQPTSFDGRPYNVNARCIYGGQAPVYFLFTITHGEGN